jgi:phosphoglucosamine mutase
VLELMASSGKSLKELKTGMEKYPQTMINVPVSPAGKDRLDQSKRLQQAVAEIERELAGAGRVILRPSGTEPLVRVTLEGADQALVQRLTEQLADTVRSELGG